jgi:hypothetical protein
MLPTHLLRIESLQDRDVRVSLEDGSKYEASAYATLSRCWGKLQPIPLTMATNTVLQASVPT